MLRRSFLGFLTSLFAINIAAQDQPNPITQRTTSHTHADGSAEDFVMIQYVLVSTKEPVYPVAPQDTRGLVGEVKGTGPNVYRCTKCGVLATRHE